MSILHTMISLAASFLLMSTAGAEQSRLPSPSLADAHVHLSAESVEPLDRLVMPASQPFAIAEATSDNSPHRPVIAAPRHQERFASSSTAVNAGLTIVAQALRAADHIRDSHL